MVFLGVGMLRALEPWRVFSKFQNVGSAARAAAFLPNHGSSSAFPVLPASAAASFNALTRSLQPCAVLRPALPLRPAPWPRPGRSLWL